MLGKQTEKEGRAEEDSPLAESQPLFAIKPPCYSLLPSAVSFCFHFCFSSFLSQNSCYFASRYQQHHHCANSLFVCYSRNCLLGDRWQNMSVKIPYSDKGKVNYLNYTTKCDLRISSITKVNGGGEGADLVPREQ